MFRLVRNVLVLIVVAALVAAGIFVCTSADPFYALIVLNQPLVAGFRGLWSRGACVRGGTLGCAPCGAGGLAR